MYVSHPRRVRVTGNRYSPQVPAGALWAMREAPGHARSPYCNPHAVKSECKKTCGRGVFHTLDDALRLYGEYLDQRPDIVRRAAAEPGTVRFACRCPLDQPCHVDELMRRVDQLRAVV